MISTFSYVYLVAAGLASAAAVRLMMGRKQSAEKILSAALLLPAFHSVLLFVDTRNPFHHSPVQQTLMITAEITLWILLYFYSGCITGRLTRLKPAHLLHFLVPLLLFMPLMWSVETIPPNPMKPSFLNRMNPKEIKVFPQPPWRGSKPGFDIRRGGAGETIVYTRAGVQVLAWLYILLMIFDLVNYSRKIRARSTARERSNMIRLTVFTTVTGMIQTLMTFLLVFAAGSGRWFIFFRISKSIPVPLFYILTLAGFALLARNRTAEEKKYGKNLIETAELDKHSRALIAYMAHQKPYRSESLTLKQLADALDMHANDLSQLINKIYDCHFKDFINAFRVEEVKEELLKPANKDKNILTIAYDAGFNSKSGFNLVFKKHTQMTPSEFIKKSPPAGTRRVHPLANAVPFCTIYTTVQDVGR